MYVALAHEEVIDDDDGAKRCHEDTVRPKEAMTVLVSRRQKGSQNLSPEESRRISHELPRLHNYSKDSTKNLSPSDGEPLGE